MIPFMGEVMKCVMCGKEEKSDPQVESGWRAVEAYGVVYYVCPEELPPDGAVAKQFQDAYEKILERILK